MFSSLRERDFAWYFAGNSAFFLAMQMSFLLQGWLAWQLTDRALALGLVGIAVGLPMLVIAPFGGVVADRVNKRTLLLVGQLFLTAVNVVLTVLILADVVEFWHLLIATVGLGLTFATVMPARQAIVPMLVPQHRMMNAVVLQMGSMNVTRIIGPAAAGLLLVFLSMGTVWAITTGLFFISVLTVLPLPAYGMKEGTRSKSFASDFAGGFRYILHRPLLRMLIVSAMMMPLFVFPVQMVLPVFVDDVWGRGEGALGILTSAAGVGGLVGTLITANFDRVPAKGRIMLAGALLLGTCYIVFAVAPMFWLALVMFGIGNIGGMVFQTTNNSTIQAIVDDEVRGRVLSVMMMSFGIMPFGILPLTAAIDAFGAPVTVAVSTSVSLVLLLLLFTVSGQLRGLRLDALEYADLSPAQAAKLVAEGKISREEAARLTGRAARSNGASPTTEEPRGAPASVE
jgi:MFS transporter, DHA1 family, staphyloferrin A biosynthesis exporter